MESATPKTWREAKHAPKCSGAMRLQGDLRKRLTRSHEQDFAWPIRSHVTQAIGASSKFSRTLPDRVSPIARSFNEPATKSASNDAVVGNRRNKCLSCRRQELKEAECEHGSIASEPAVHAQQKSSMLGVYTLDFRAREGNIVQRKRYRNVLKPAAIGFAWLRWTITLVVRTRSAAESDDLNTRCELASCRNSIPLL